MGVGVSGKARIFAAMMPAGAAIAICSLLRLSTGWHYQSVSVLSLLPEREKSPVNSAIFVPTNFYRAA